MAIAILSGLVTPAFEIAKFLLSPFKNKVEQIISYRKNVRVLKDEVLALTESKSSVQQAVEDASQRGEMVTYGVQLWLNNVDELEYDVERFKAAMEENMGCKGFCFSLNSRYQLSRKAEEMTLAARELKSDGKFSSISVQTRQAAAPPGIELFSAGDFQAFESTKSAMVQITEALEDMWISVIGVYGMGGVGKTMLMKEVAKQVKTNNIFDHVIVTTVSQSPDITSIQAEIAEMIGFQLWEESTSVRAQRLSQWLIHCGRVLIILDDVWERMELEDLGISGLHIDCKVVLTTRSLDVCNLMDSQTNIKVNVLSCEDSWKLFGRVAGNVIESRELCSVAKDVARKCGGLPIALVTIGRALRTKKASAWIAAAKELSSSASADIKGVSKKVFTCIKLSFDYLPDREAKLCFLYCSVFPEDHDIAVENLVRYAKSEGFLVDVDTLWEARDRVHAIIDELKACCLLLGSEKEGCVKMHDVVRDVAIAISSINEYCFMVKARTGLKEWPRSGRSESVLRMSLMNNEISSLPTEVECPKLLVLLMQNNRLLRDFQDDFFSSTKALRILDLSSIAPTTSLPESLSILTKLKMLCLENNKLVDIAMLGELGTLEILSLKKSSIEVFPEEIGKLTRLRLMDLTNCSVRRIPPNVISNLSQLEELYMVGSFSKWGVEASETEGQANVAEIASLSNLSTLHICIDDYTCLFKDIFSSAQDLQNFYIQVGGDACLLETTAMRAMHLGMPDHVEDLTERMAEWVKIMMQRTEKLSLVRWKYLQNADQLVADGFMECVGCLAIKRCDIDIVFSSRFHEALSTVQHLHVSSCYKLRAVLQASPDDDLTNPMLPQLETLVLKDLPALRTILKGPNPSLCFHKLRVLTVQGCGALKFLFLPDLAETLQQLVSLNISDCLRMETIISYGMRKQQAYPRKKITLPNLAFISLINLGQISRLSDDTVLLDVPSLEELNVNSCPYFTHPLDVSFSHHFKFNKSQLTPPVC